MASASSNRTSAAERVQRTLEAFCAGGDGRGAAFRSVVTGGDFLGARLDVARPAASVIKVPLVMALYDLDASGAVSLDTEIAVADLGATRYASILAAFHESRRLSLRELAGLALIVSDNPATVQVMTHAGPAAVAEVLSQAGCSGVSRMAAGFSEAELGPPNRANILTAADAVRVFDHLAAEARYAPVVRMLENNLRNNRIPALLPEDVVVAHKTGSLEGVVNDVGIVSYGGRSFTLAVLADGEPDPIQTSREIAELALALAADVLDHPDLRS